MAEKGFNYLKKRISIIFIFIASFLNFTYHEYDAKEVKKTVSTVSKKEAEKPI